MRSVAATAPLIPRWTKVGYRPSLYRLHQPVASVEAEPHRGDLLCQTT